MQLVHPELVPSSPPSRDRMREIQRSIRSLASWPNELQDTAVSSSTVVGLDVAFTDDTAVAAAVAMQNGHVLAESTVCEPIQFPYVPGFLAFRELPPLLAVLDKIDITPDIILCDGNGRLHPREAGIATHLGVVLDCQTVGVAKSLLCGRLDSSADPPYPVGTRIPIRAGGGHQAPEHTILGIALQTRQWEAANRHINPVYVSPGHRCNPDGAADIVGALCSEYKLPDPIRNADKVADERAHPAAE